MSRNAEHDQQVRDERREQILAHALTLFAANGLAATKITDIATAVGMAQGLLYHYFRSKEVIFTEIIRRAFENMNRAAYALEEMPLAPREKIRQALVQILRGMEEGEAFAQSVLLIAQAGVSDATPAEAKAIIRTESSVPYDVVTRIMRAGQQNGSIKQQYDAAALSMVFWTTIKGLALHKAVHGAAFKAPDAGMLTSIFFAED